MTVSDIRNLVLGHLNSSSPTNVSLLTERVGRKQVSSESLSSEMLNNGQNPETK